MNARVYEHITNRIIALLNEGTVPWHKPWKARTGLPRNFVTSRLFLQRLSGDRIEITAVHRPPIRR